MLNGFHLFDNKSVRCRDTEKHKGTAINCHESRFYRYTRRTERKNRSIQRVLENCDPDLPGQQGNHGVQQIAEKKNREKAEKRIGEKDKPSVDQDSYITMRVLEGTERTGHNLTHFSILLINTALSTGLRR